MHTLVCVPILNIVLSFLTSFYRLSATMSVPSRLCFRVETPTSAARFSRRFGIVSKAYRDAYENNRSTRRRDIPAQIDPPLAAKSQSKIIKHLRGDRFPSPFISATRDIYRALSIASSRLFHAWQPDNIMLCVIDEDRLREEPLYVPDYFRDMSNIYNSVLIHDICYIVNTAKLNDEIIIRRYVPRRAILRRSIQSSDKFMRLARHLAWSRRTRQDSCSNIRPHARPRVLASTASPHRCRRVVRRRCPQSVQHPQRRLHFVPRSAPSLRAQNLPYICTLFSVSAGISVQHVLSPRSRVMKVRTKSVTQQSTATNRRPLVG